MTEHHFRYPLEHQPETDCWCQPVEIEDGVWSHREEWTVAEWEGAEKRWERAGVGGKGLEYLGAVRPLGRA